MSHKEDIAARLASLGAAYVRFDHEAAHTMADCEALPFAGPDVTFCKNLLLCNRQQTQFIFYILPAYKPFRTADVSKALGMSRLSFAPDEQLHTLLETESGSLAPFGLWYDRSGAIPFAADRDILKTPKIAFHPCDNTATFVFDQDEFWQKAAPAIRQQISWVEVPWHT